MSCKKIQKQILLQTNWPDDVKQHVQSCKSCQSFAESVRKFQALKNKSLETPTILLERTRTEAFSVLAAGTIPKANLIKTLWNSPKFVIGLAIAFLAIFVIAFNTNLYWENGFLKNLNWTILITIVIQNMIMAIFVPIFFSTKNNIFNISKRS